MNESHPPRHAFDDAPLAQPEGVNAGSADEIGEQLRPAPHGDVRSGGHPEHAGDHDHDTADGEMVGSGGQQEGYPGQQVQVGER